MQAAADQALEERRPEGLGLTGADVQPDDLAFALGVGRHSDDRRNRDDAAAFPLLEVSRVQPQIRPIADQRAIQEGIHPVVDVLAQLAHRAFADAPQPHRLHQVVHPARRHAADPRLLDYRHQRLLRRFAGLQEGREVASLP